MRTDTKLRSDERPCSFDHFLHSLDNKPAAASAIDSPRGKARLNLGEWLAVALVGTIMWTAVFAGLAS